MNKSGRNLRWLDRGGFLSSQLWKNLGRDRRSRRRRGRHRCRCRRSSSLPSWPSSVVVVVAVVVVVVAVVVFVVVVAIVAVVVVCLLACCCSPAVVVLLCAVLLWRLFSKSCLRTFSLFMHILRVVTGWLLCIHDNFRTCTSRIYYYYYYYALLTVNIAHVE